MRINYGLGALALLLSMALWVAVVNDQNPERTDTPDVSIAVEITKIPSGLVVMNNLEPVRIKVRAPKDRWSSFRASSFRAWVDLSRQGPGIQSLAVQAEASDPAVRVLEVIPASVTVRLEENQERTVPVKVNLSGNVPFGYIYGAPKVDPEVVVVSGPSSLVQSVENASVDVRLDGITVEIDTSFHPNPVDGSGSTVRNVRFNPQTVRVVLPVQQQVTYKQVAVRASVVGSVAPGYWVESVTVDPASVTVVGDPKVLANVNYLDTASLNVNGASSSVMQDLRIQTPEGVSLVQQQTSRVKVNISPLQSSQVVRAAPRVINLDPLLRVGTMPSYIDVTIQGAAPVLQSLRSDSIVVTLDLNGLGVGVHNDIKPTVSAPQGISVVSMQPQTVSVALMAIPSPTPSPSVTPSATPQPASAATPAPTSTPEPERATPVTTSVPIATPTR